jgi:hypothetical protein
MSYQDWECELIEHIRKPELGDDAKAIRRA